MANLSTEIKTIVGNLLLRADELSKRVLTAYDPSAKRSSNLKALSGFNLDLLEPCATFLGIALAESDSNKIYTKESLINRLMLGLHALLPSQCSECSECYATEFDSESDSLFTCHMCFQVSHNCAAIREKHQGLSEASIALFSIPINQSIPVVYPRNPYSRNPYFGEGISDQKPLIPTPGIPTIWC